MSVITNSRGHSKTPHVSVIVTDSPKRVNGVGVKPKSFSSEKSFVPIVSAISALQQKKAIIPRKSFVGLSLRILFIMIRNYGYSLTKEKLPEKIKIKH